MAEEAVANEWWGRWEIEEGESGCWKIGPLTLWIARRRGEWRVTYSEGSDHLEDRLEISLPDDAELDIKDATVHRFAVKGSEGVVELRPRLADRPIVVRPEMPFHLLADEEVKLYMSTAVWVEVKVDNPGRVLLEIPTFRPSDTWFGATTRSGELCYASRTSAHLLLENLPRHMARAITRIRVRNLGPDSLRLERIKLPVLALSLYADQKSSLWTDAVTVRRAKDGQMAHVQLDRVTNVTVDVKPVSEARSPHVDNVFERAIGNFLR